MKKSVLDVLNVLGGSEDSRELIFELEATSPCTIVIIGADDIGTDDIKVGEYKYTTASQTFVRDLVCHRMQTVSYTFSLATGTIKITIYDSTQLQSLTYNGEELL